MNPVSPVMPGSQPIEIVLGKDQEEYVDLPAVYLDTPSRTMITRWRLTDEERQAIAAGADIVLQTLTFRQPFQPVNLQVVMPDESPQLLEPEPPPSQRHNTAIPSMRVNRINNDLYLSAIPKELGFTLGEPVDSPDDIWFTGWKEDFYDGGVVGQLVQKHPTEMKFCLVNLPGMETAAIAEGEVFPIGTDRLQDSSLDHMRELFTAGMTKLRELVEQERKKGIQD